MSFNPSAMYYQMKLDAENNARRDQIIVQATNMSMSDTAPSSTIVSSATRDTIAVIPETTTTSI